MDEVVEKTVNYLQQWRNQLRAITSCTIRLLVVVNNEY